MGIQIFYTHVQHVPAAIEFVVAGSPAKRLRQNSVHIELLKPAESGEPNAQEWLKIQDKSVAADGLEHSIRLPADQVGLYKLMVISHHAFTRMRWNSPLPLVIKSSADEPMDSKYSNLWLLYFYVPKGTKTIVLYGGGHGEVRDSNGLTVFWLNGREPNAYGVDVPDGEDGKLWSIRYGHGAVRLLNVPPYFALSAAELLLPEEIVEQDKARWYSTEITASDPEKRTENRISESRKPI